jgi:hypothetical protein
MYFPEYSHPQRFTDKNIYPQKTELSKFWKIYKQKENHQRQLQIFNNHHNNNVTFFTEFYNDTRRMEYNNRLMKPIDPDTYFDKERSMHYNYTKFKEVLSKFGI